MKKLIVVFLVLLLVFVGIANVLAQVDEATPTADVIVSTATLVSSTDAPTLTAIPTATATPTQPPTDGSDGEQPAPPDALDLALAAVLAIIVVCERWVTFSKPFLVTISENLKLSDQNYNSLVVGYSMVVGVVLVLLSNQPLNLLVLLPIFPPIVGTILTGVLIGGGAGAVHAVYDVLRGITAANRAKAVNVYAQFPSASMQRVPSELK